MKAPGRASSMKEKSSAPITGGDVVVDALAPDDLGGDRGGERGLPLVVAGHRIVALVGELGLGAVEPRGAFHHLVQALLQEVAHLGREAARGAAQVRGLRDDVVGRCRPGTCRSRSTADCSGSTLRATIDWIWLMIWAPTSTVSIEMMRPRRVPALAFDLDREAVGRRHQRARPDRELADRQARIIVHAVDFLDAEALHQAVLDHGLAAGAALLGRLEDHHRGAGEIARLGEIARGAEQHGGVAVMAAGVHLAGHRRLVGEVGRLLDRQRVHVGAQPDHLAGASPRPLPPRMTPTTPVRPIPVTTSSQPKLLSFSATAGRGAVHVVEQLRMGMKVVPPGGDLAVQVGDTIDDRHRDGSGL